jgi:hypothetical protein
MSVSAILLRPSRRIRAVWTSAAAATALGAAGLGAAVALADDATHRGALLPGEKVKDTLPPEGAKRTAGLAVLAGVPCTVTVRAAGKSQVRPTVVYTDATGTRVYPGAALREKGGSSRLRGFRFETTGVCRATLSTPRDAGGAFELSYASRPPSRAAARGTAAGDPAAGVVTFDAHAGTTLQSLSIVATAKPAWAPTVEILGPGGVSLGAVTGAGSKATLRGVVLPDLGTYSVKVTGGTGEFRMVAALRPPKKSPRTWAGVEAAPLVTSFAPPSSPNDTQLQFALTGVGLSTRHSVRFSQGGVNRFTRLVTAEADDGATVALDLEGVAPGAYDLSVSSPAGHVVPLAAPFVVTNRVPVITRAEPELVPNGTYPDGAPVTVHGAGIDVGATVEVRLASDGTLVPTTVETRVSHARLELKLAIPDYVTGKCSVDVTDPGGAKTRLADGIDIVGLRGAPKRLWSYAGGDYDLGLQPYDADYDPETGHALVALLDGDRAVLVLVDCADLSVLDTRVVTGGSGRYLDAVAVAWNATQGTWGLVAVVRQAGTAADSAYYWVIDRSDLDVSVGSGVLGSAAEVSEADIAPDLVSGGWMAVYDRWAGGTAKAEIRAQPIGPAGTMDSLRQTTLMEAALGGVNAPAIGNLSGRRFLVVNAAEAGSVPNLARTVRRTIIDSDGAVVGGNNEVGGSNLWATVWRFRMARNPHDGTTLVTFNTSDVSSSRGRAFTVSDGSGHTSDIREVAPELQGGSWAWDVGWSEARREFVVGAYLGGELSTLLRMDSAALRVPAPIADFYWGQCPVVFGGADDDLHVGIASDAAYDEVLGSGGIVDLRVAPVR